MAVIRAREQSWSDIIQSRCELQTPNVCRSIEPGPFVYEFRHGCAIFSFQIGVETLLSPPAQINLGINALAVKNIFADLDFMLGVKKPIEKTAGSPDYQGESSTALTSDWNDFPNDMTVQVGLNYLFHPVYLGAGVSSIQEMYVGYFSTGPKDAAISYYTHGFTIGIETDGIKATVGYAGRWHNNNFDYFLGNSNLPWETFQFGLSSDLSVIRKKNEEGTAHELPKNIIISGGYSYGYSVGIMKSISTEGANISFASNSNWAIESDFYINDNAAILTSFTYSRMKETATINSLPEPSFLSFSLDIPMETTSLESGFRYHPIDIFHPLFVPSISRHHSIEPCLWVHFSEIFL